MTNHNHLYKNGASNKREPKAIHPIGEVIELKDLYKHLYYIIGI